MLYSSDKTYVFKQGTTLFSQIGGFSRVDALGKNTYPCDFGSFGIPEDDRKRSPIDCSFPSKYSSFRLEIPD
jgi:hypothetical protein